MESLNVRVKIILRVILMGVILLSFFYAIMQKEWYVTSCFLFVLFIIGLVELIHFLEKWNREFNSLLLSIKTRDFSNRYPALSNNSKEFRRAFTDLMDVYQDIKIEKELHYQYLQRLIENIRVAVICFEDSGKVISINSSAKNLLGIASMQHVQSIHRISPELFKAIMDTNSPSGHLVSVHIGGEILQLAIHGSRFKLKDTGYLLVSLQNIRQELEVQEAEAWKKLIRVLTHEIMNSVTPISSLSSVLNERLKDESRRLKDISEFTADDLEDLYCGLSTIENRSKGLLGFINSYKSLTKLPSPSFTEVNVSALISSVIQLLESDLSLKKIRLVVEQPDPSLVISADRVMIEQVIINLMANSMDALSGIPEPQIMISACSNEREKMIEVHDNGKGIAEENINDIFVPFFSTKEHGSGIGLSLSRQIMNMHGGSISVRSTPGTETIFRLGFLL